MSGNSPVWKRPSDVMKIHHKKRSSIHRPGYRASPKQSAAETECTDTENKARNKRKNPFGCSPRKRVNIKSDIVAEHQQDIESGHHGILLDVLNKKDQGACNSPAPMCMDTETVLARGLMDKAPSKPDRAHSTSSNTSLQSSRPPPAKESNRCFPQDWSLRLKARYVSSQSFSWCCPLKAGEEAQGMERSLQNTDPLTEKNPPTGLAKAELHRCCLYWVHPNIPWLKLFPRMVPDNKIGKCSAVLQDKDVLDSLMADWTDSFTSAFHLLRTGALQDFYLSCHQFTVAFLAANRQQSCPLQAIITPTSRGVREALKTEGIEFTLPLQPKPDTEGSSADKPTQSQTNPSSQLNGETRIESASTEAEAETEVNDLDEEGLEEDEDLEPTDEGAASWLETLGLDKRQYKSLDPNKVKLQRDTFRVIDNRPESTVLVTGHQTQALFNYLLNCRSCVANTGVQGGIPPTILSASTFKGATLKTLKVKQGSIRQLSSSQPGYSLEVLGPLLPSTYRKMNHLLSLTQPDYTATYSVHDVTSPFNLLTQSVEEEPNNEDSLDRSFSVKLGKEVIHELNYSDDGFTWTKY